MQDDSSEIPEFIREAYEELSRDLQESEYTISGRG